MSGDHCWTTSKSGGLQAGASGECLTRRQVHAHRSRKRTYMERMFTTRMEMWKMESAGKVGEEQQRVALLGYEGKLQRSIRYRKGSAVS